MYNTPYQPSLASIVYSSASAMYNTPREQVTPNIERVIEQTSPLYETRKEEKQYQPAHQHHEYHFHPETFIVQTHDSFIEDAEPLKQYITTTFETLTQKPFPKDISITICNQEKFAQVHECITGSKSDHVLGFALNRRGFGTSELFIRAGNLAQVMLTVGHEIGHVMSLPLKNNRTEEAKAYAFSLAWIQTIKEHNIAMLHDHITIQPANNGVHNIAFQFVQEKIKEGMHALNIFHALTAQHCEV